MSFNPNDNSSFSINRTNYEEYFILYIDNELTAGQRAAVEAFVASHPALKAELDLLSDTKLSADSPVIMDKQSLYAEQMQCSEAEERLLLYIDQELSEADKKRVEEKLSADAAYQLHYQSLAQTKAEADNTIIYPYKTELYRSSQPARPLYAPLRAAAVLLLLAGTAFFGWLHYHPTTQQRSIVQQHRTSPVKKEVRQSNVIATPRPSIPAAQDVALEPVAAQPQKNAAIISPGKHSKKETSVAAHSLKTVLQEEAMAVHIPVIKKELPAAKLLSKYPALSLPLSQDSMTLKKNNAALGVTNTNNTAYTTKEATETTPAPDAVAMEKTTKVRMPLKGILRKATRFIGRRTNIYPANEDDELLIGSVAIQLK